MNRNEIIEGLKQLLQKQPQIQYDVDTLEEDTSIERVGFDSISILDFIYDVEDHFNIRIEVADLAAMNQVRDLIDYVEGKLVK